MPTPREPLESVYPRVFLSTVGPWGCTFRAISQDQSKEYVGTIVYDEESGELWGFSTDPDWRGLRGGVQVERWSKYLKVAAAKLREARREGGS